MVVQTFFKSRTLNWYKIYCLLMVLALAAIVPSNILQHTPSPASHTQAQLLEMAVQQPNEQVNVIVQKLEVSNNVENQVRKLGGVVTAELHIINGFGATLPAKAVPELGTTPGVRWISLDAPVVKSGISEDQIDTSNLKNTYISDIRAAQVWNELHYQGDGIGVAVVDSGIDPAADFFTQTGYDRVTAAVSFGKGTNHSVYDGYGHGSHIAGIIGGNGGNSGGAYIGVAPKSNLINVKVSDNKGAATILSVVEGLQWVNDLRDVLHIRVVNISLNATVSDSYINDPLDAAVEVLWFNKVVVVTSAGNNGKEAVYAPANDPFAITVGAVDDKGTTSLSDDVMASFSAFGPTKDSISKPDLVAPGTNIVSVLGSPAEELALAHPGNVVNNHYFRMSGTSVAAPMVTGVVALLLQANPDLTPDQVKYRLTATARPFATRQKAGVGYLDAYAAVTGTTTASANTGIHLNHLLKLGNSSIAWDSVSWNSVSWNSVSWNSVSWNSVSWNSVSWNSDYWGN